MRGTAKPTREHAEHEAVEVADQPEPPSWLRAAEKKIWAAKLEKYADRGMSIDGCEDAFAQYVVLEGELIRMYRKRETIPQAMRNAHRIFAGEFLDTPASQLTAGMNRGAGKPGNKFSGHGKRPG